MHESNANVEFRRLQQITYMGGTKENLMMVIFFNQWIFNPWILNPWIKHPWILNPWIKHPWIEHPWI